MKTIYLLFISLFLSTVAHADISFSNLTQADMDGIVSDFTADFMPTTVSSARPLGSIFGFELGLLAGATQDKNIEATVERSTGQPFSDKIPHGTLFGVFTIPFGITFEGGGIPEVNGQNGGKFSYSFAGLKWSFWTTIVDMAIKADVAKVNFRYNQLVSGVNTEVDYVENISSAMLMLSKNFIFIEPYIGIGTLHGDGTLTVTGTGTIFNSTYTSGQTGNSVQNSGVTVVGLNLNLFVLRLGAEYAKSYSEDSLTAKLSVYF